MTIGSSRFRTIALLTTIFTIIIFTLMINTTLEKNKKSILHSTKNDLEFILVTTKNRLSDWLKEREDYIYQVGKDPQLVALTKALLNINIESQALKSSAELKNIRLYLLTEKETFSEMGFFIVNKDFINIASKRDSNIGIKNLIAIQKPELLNKVWQGEAVFVPPILSDVSFERDELIKGNDKKPYTMFFAAPIQDKKGKVIAILTQRLRVEDKFSNILQIGRIKHTGESYIFNKEGHMLSKSRFYNNLHKEKLINKSSKINDFIKIRDPGGNLLKGFKPIISINDLPLTTMAKSAISLRHQSGNSYSKIISNVEGYRDYRGVSVFGSWMWSNEFDFGITVEINKDEVLESYFILRHNLFTTTALMFIFAILATLVVIILGERSNKAILKSNKELNNILFAYDTNVIASRTDLKGIITYASDAFCKISGYKREELIGYPHNIVRHPDMDKNTFKNLWKTIKAGKTWRGEVKNLKKDGGFYWVEATVQPDFNERGKIIGYSAIRHDITSKKEVDKQRVEIDKQHTMIMTQAKVAAVGEMIGNIAHQWRQPLTTISASMINLRANVELDEEITNDDILQTVDKVSNQCQYLSSTIDDFRNFFKADSRNITTFDLKEGLEKTINLIQDSYKNNFIEIIEDLESCSITDNKNTFIQSMINLFNNTKDAMVINNIPSTQRYLFITMQQTKNEIIIDFKDSGGGIQEEAINSIFEPYFTTKHQSKGTGLGLYMTHQIIIQHLKGTIMVENCDYMYNDKKLRGAHFIITIPRVRT